MKAESAISSSGSVTSVANVGSARAKISRSRAPYRRFLRGRADITALSATVVGRRRGGSNLGRPQELSPVWTTYTRVISDGPLPPEGRDPEGGGHAPHADQDVPVAEGSHERDLAPGDVEDDQPGHPEQADGDEGGRDPASAGRGLDLLRLRLRRRLLLLLALGRLTDSGLGHAANSS